MESIHVAAGALIDPQGRVLIARRHDDAHQGGLWEFPGGKCETGETIESALARELHEELGVSVLAHRPLIRVAHEYADRRVLLDVHLVTDEDIASGDSYAAKIGAVTDAARELRLGTNGSKGQ